MNKYIFYKFPIPALGNLVNIDSDDFQPVPHQGPLLLTWFNFNPSMDK